MSGEVVSWDCSIEGPAEPETWVQVHIRAKVCGGHPNVVAADSDGRLYRHTPNGLLWKRLTPRFGAGGATE